MLCMVQVPREETEAEARFRLGALLFPLAPETKSNFEGPLI